VNDFVERCRREWKRLRVPDAIANEMAADLAADLKEAADEGVTAEEVLGSGAADARSFAASWAAERGVVPPTRLAARLPRRSPTLVAIATLTVITAIGAALVIFASPHASAPTAEPAFFVLADGSQIAVRISPPSPSPTNVSFDGREVWVAPAPGSDVHRLPQGHGSGVEINRVGSILLIVGIVGIILLMLLLFWSSRATPEHRPSQ
jgi:hypothetical protein